MVIKNDILSMLTKKQIPQIIILLVISIILSLPFLKPGLYMIHDDQQIARLFVFDQALKSGQFPVRWVDGLGFGFGYPLFNFYPPFVYYFGEIFNILGFGFINSIKLVFFISIFASGLAMYIFTRQVFKEIPSLVSALFYMVIPYRAVDIYVRGALAESFSFVWLPLILWSICKLQKEKSLKFVIFTSVFLALFMITHNLIFLALMTLLPFYLIFLLWGSQSRKKLLKVFFLSICLGFALSAFFWLPALYEKKYTIVNDLLLVNLANYKIHFVYPQQLWNWQWGFGGSAVGLADGISFKIGKLHVILSIAALILASCHLFKKVKNNHLYNSKLTILFFTLFSFSALKSTFCSRPIWDLIQPLSYLQFPWRYLIFTALFSSILAGAFFNLLRLPILNIYGSLIIIILLFIPNLKLFKPQSYRPDLTDKLATSHEVINWYVSSSSFEYLPKGVELVKSSLGTNVVDITKNEIPANKIDVIGGEATISDLKVTPARVDFRVNAASDAKIKANIFNFPGWQVILDESRLKIDDNNRLKLITFDVPGGVHQIKLIFRNTAIRYFSNSISFFSVLILILLIFKRWLTPKIN